MPRLGWRLLRSVSRELRLLLPPNNGDLESARSEYRWIREKFNSDRQQIAKSCRARSKFVPLQYILGEHHSDEVESQPFGELDIKCRPGVLIPRWETEEWSTALATRINHLFSKINSGGQKDEHGGKPLTIVDLCTGTGCIALSLSNLVEGPTRLIGLDHSQASISLAGKNLTFNRHAIPATSQVEFRRGDIFDDSLARVIQDADVIVMNPPYIRIEEERHISLSTRRFEPRDALVPSESLDSGEIFYQRIVNLFALSRCEMRCRIMAFEVDGKQQADRVTSYIRRKLPGFETSILPDSAGIDRCVYAQC